MQIKKSSVQIKKSASIYNQCTVSYSESESKSDFNSYFKSGTESYAESDNSVFINLVICIFFCPTFIFF